MIAGFRRKNPLRPGAELCPRNWHVEKKRLKGHLRDQRVSLEAASPCTTWVVGLVAGRVEWLAGALRWVSWAVEETGAFRCTNMMGQEIWSILVYYGTWHKVWSCEGFIAGKRSTRHLRWSLWCWPWNSFEPLDRYIWVNYIPLTTKPPEIMLSGLVTGTTPIPPQRALM